MQETIIMEEWACKGISTCRSMDPPVEVFFSGVDISVTISLYFGLNSEEIVLNRALISIWSLKLKRESRVLSTIDSVV